MTNNNNSHRYSNLLCNLYHTGWFSLTDCYRFGLSPQYYLDTRHGCSRLLWEVKGNEHEQKLSLKKKTIPDCIFF